MIYCNALQAGDGDDDNLELVSGGFAAPGDAARDPEQNNRRGASVHLASDNRQTYLDADRKSYVYRLFLSVLISVNDDKNRHHTSIGVVDHITAMLAMRDESAPTDSISVEFIERYLKLMTIKPVLNEVKCYESVLNHPFIRFIQGRCYDAELSQFPYPFGSMLTTSGMCATSLSDMGVSVSCLSDQGMLDAHARSGTDWLSWPKVLSTSGAMVPGCVESDH